MTTCERFESEGLERFVAGEPLDGHFATCPDCLAAHASYRAVVRTLEEARTAYRPPGDWEAKVWARIRRQEAARPRPRWLPVLGLVTTGAAAALAVFVMGGTGGPESLELNLGLERGTGPIVRGGPSIAGQELSGAPGNVLHLTAQIPRKKLGDLRVYRGKDELVFQCEKSPDCIHTKNGFEARVTLDRAGTYRTLIIGADRELPPATGNLDEDTAAAMLAGEAHESVPIEIL